MQTVWEGCFKYSTFSLGCTREYKENVVDKWTWISDQMVGSRRSRDARPGDSGMSMSSVLLTFRAHYVILVIVERFSGGLWTTFLRWFGWIPSVHGT